MPWILAVVPVIISVLAHILTGWIHAGIVAYHAWCVVVLLWRRSLLRGEFIWTRATLVWTAVATALFVGGLLVPLLFWDPTPLKEAVQEQLFPMKNPHTLFWVFVAYTLLIHVPLEELTWRIVIFRSFLHRGFRVWNAVLLNGLFFYALHAGPLHLAGFRWGWLLAIPTGLAGAAWAVLRERSGSMWPLLVSHAAVCAAILEGVRRFFIS